MMDFLNFAFQGFWHFVGCLMIISVVGSIFVGALAKIASAVRSIHK